VEFSWTAWLISVAAVLVSALLAWMRGDLRKRPGLDMGFANHGGMWGDLVLLPVANGAIVPHLASGLWIAPSVALCLALSVWVHRHWYRGDRDVDGRQLSVDSHLSTVDGSWSRVEGTHGAVHSREHMWPSRPFGSWWKDLSGAGWAHVAYVAGELTLLTGFLLFPMPNVVVGLVCAIFTLHMPLGLLQPRWFLSGEIASARKQPLLVPLLGTLWVVGFLKL
jgi:hypothetical protein